MTAVEALELTIGGQTLTINPDPFWRAVRRELCTNAEVRAECGGIPRSTLIAWRRDQGFPAPVMTFNPDAQSSVELWSRTAVRDWYAENKAR